MICITTFSKRGYRKYGKRFLESYVNYWSIPINVYHESKPEFRHPLITYKRLDKIKLPKGTARDYIYSVRHLHPTSYNDDVSKFCRKVFVQYDNQKGKVFWIDADTVCDKKMPSEFLENLFKGSPLAYFGRPSHTETGFVGFDHDHPKSKRFMDEYIDVYMSGNIFNLKYWHDCGAFDHAREICGIEGNNLTPDSARGLHVIVQSELGKYIDHCKGSRKNQGFSPER